MSARHVVLITYGEPPSPDFLDQLRYSWRILLGLTRTVAPIPRPVLPWIAVRRARLRWRTWREEDYGSPLERHTRAQADGVAGALARIAPAIGWQAHAAYEFRDPSLPQVLDALPTDEPVDIVPMYVVDSAFTHEISRATLAAWLRKRYPNAHRRAPVRVIPPLDEATLAEASVRHVRNALAAADWTSGADCALVLAAHGTLLEPPRPMETGRLATERLAREIAAMLSADFGMVVHGWLNHVYGGRWTEPPIEAALRQVEAAGFRRVVYFPYGFVADNAESELEGRVALRVRSGLSAFHLPCLNSAPAYLEAVAAQLAAAAS